jgi:hypothetical protein
MLLELRSQKFSFERGEVGLVPQDWEKLALLGQWVPDTLQLEHNRIADAPVDRPNRFLLILGGLSVVRKSDQHTFSVSSFIAEVNVQDRDMADGKAIIPMEPDGLYQITLFDPAEHRPLPQRRLSFSLISSTFVYETGVDTDDGGRITFLGKPTMFRIEIERDMGLTILPI